MAWLIQTEFCFIQAGGRQHSDRTGHHTCLIGKDISEHILGQDDIELFRVTHQLHGTVVYQHMLQCDIRVIFCNVFHNGSPQSGRIQNVCLIHTGYFMAAFSCNVKSTDSDTADLILIIRKCINGFAYSVLLGCVTLSEIQTAGQLTHDHHIKTVTDDIITQRAGLF